MDKKILEFCRIQSQLLRLERAYRYDASGLLQQVL